MLKVLDSLELAIESSEAARVLSPERRVEAHRQPPKRILNCGEAKHI